MALVYCPNQRKCHLSSKRKTKRKVKVKVKGRTKKKENKKKKKKQLVIDASAPCTWSAISSECHDIAGPVRQGVRAPEHVLDEATKIHTLLVYN